MRWIGGAIVVGGLAAGGFAAADDVTTFGSRGVVEIAAGSAAVPLVVHPVPHFFFEVGPAFFTDLSSSYSSGGASMDDSKNTSFSVFAAIGGWL